MKSLRTGIYFTAAAAAVALFTVAAPATSHAQMMMQNCNFMWQPVCAISKDGKKRAYANDCWAKRDNATHIKAGACK